MTRSPAQLAAFRALICARLGLALPERLSRSLLAGILAASQVLAEPESEALCRRLEALSWQSPAWQAIIDRVTVRETTFLRQRDWWESIVETVLRPLIAARRLEGTRRLTLLCAGCASGEEPYSLALLIDKMLAGEPGWRITLTGMDLCATALAQARLGRFDARAVRELSPAERTHWFQREPGGHYRLDPRIRQMVAFHPVNLVALASGTDHWPMPGPLADLVICRNVLIHLDPARQPEIAHFLTGLVAPGGYLAVAPVEATAAWFAPLQFESHGPAILFSRGKVPPGAAPLAPPESPAVDRAPALRLVEDQGAPARAAIPEVRPRTALPTPGTDAVRLEEACRLADRGLLAEARRLCGEALAGSPEADLLMALVCQALGDHPAAREAVARALSATPEDPAAHYVRAILWLHDGRTDQARSALEQAVALLDAGMASRRLGGSLAIDASQIRQAARRLGIASGGRHARI